MTEFRTFEVVQNWGVAFSKGSSRTWWRLLCPGKYKHVSLFKYSAAADSWIYLDLDFSGMGVIIAPGDTEAVEVICLAMGDVDALTINVQERVPIIFRGLFTCVSFVKHVLGIRAPLVFFPDQLYNHLVKIGAQPMPTGSNGGRCV